jgi:DNA-binding transcriptional ArsR family regulator
VPTLTLDRATHALTDPTRRRILEIVRSEERAAGDIAAHFDVSRPAISQHLGVLRGAGLVSTRRAGRRHLYRARPEGLSELHEWMGKFWAGALDDLKLAAESEHRARTKKEDGR